MIVCVDMGFVYGCTCISMDASALVMRMANQLVYDRFDSAI